MGRNPLFLFFFLFSEHMFFFVQTIQKKHSKNFWLIPQFYFAKICTVCTNWQFCPLNLVKMGFGGKIFSKIFQKMVKNGQKTLVKSFVILTWAKNLRFFSKKGVSTKKLKKWGVWNPKKMKKIFWTPFRKKFLAHPKKSCTKI